VQTLMGENGVALGEFNRIFKMKKPKPQPPEWADLVMSLNLFDTLKLFGKIGPGKSPLASYFAFLTVEYSPLPSLPINYARAALQQDPYGLRLEQAIGDNGGISLNHQVTEEMPRMLNRMTSRLAEDADDPAIRDAATTALQQQFSQQAVVQLRDALESRPPEAGQPLPWSTYSAFLRESEFINALNRLNFVAYEWAVDPSDEIRQWWPLVSDHRYAPLLAAVNSYNQHATPELLKKVEEINFKDDVFHCHNVPVFLAGIGLTAATDKYLAFYNRETNQEDGTSWDRAGQIWQFEGNGDKAFETYQAYYLQAMCSHHPLAVTYAFTSNWKALSSAADGVLKASNNPIVSYGIARAYLENNETDKAIPILRDLVKTAPDLNCYRALTNAYLSQNDEKSWLSTWDEYLNNVEDFGLDHAVVGQTVAEHLNWQQRSDEALSYAKIAADSYSASGLQIYAWTLADVRQYDQAAAVMEQNFERYNDPEIPYRFFVTLGRGNRDGTAKAYPQWFANDPQHDDPGVELDYSVYLMLEGQAEQADAMLHRSFDQKPYRLTALLLALRAVEQNKPGDVAALFAKAHATAAQNDAAARYDLCIDEFERCLKSPTTLPARDGRLAASFADWTASPQNISIAYVMGRLCEIRKKPDDARWWYHQAFIYPQDDYTLRPLAAVALRRLGDDPYK
jgi:tetratricopeptide (TPR) repeat protein